MTRRVRPGSAYGEWLKLDPSMPRPPWLLTVPRETAEDEVWHRLAERIAEVLREMEAGR